ncbi:8-oxo-dGTP pyrophosphatase MutT (NUDIX family) [Deinococcus metalli]|uniref:8-oxo-dGTP pyrophosphatase MutT (NUDIX family) n=1 Tax=Deinococcus metalli TaxID=1141878 RepID=A0A7W8KGS8_9DEIO|nr:NUDIX hydrolase [Deinococcus metalli]MBB5376259.1 8-oxo-dGTP pyrophosphatase MutT (NUDIX family) [Deinococcus metalli]GHF39654.1 DNA mismatch repair protein MutT [Deinococcus metalli]
MTAAGYVRHLRDRIGHAPVNWAGVCALLVTADGEVLLQQRSDTGTWGTPGGIAELGEALEDTLRRELLEETGVSPREPLLFTVISGPDTFVRLPNGDEFYQITTVYVIRQWDSDLRPDGHEGRALQFFPLDALPGDLGPVDRRALDLLRVCFSVY